MKSAGLYEVIKSCFFSMLKRITRVKLIGKSTVCLKNTPCKQAAHVELFYPGILQQYHGQFVTKMLAGQLLGLINEICIVLQC